MTPACQQWVAQLQHFIQSVQRELCALAPGMERGPRDAGADARFKSFMQAVVENLSQLAEAIHVGTQQVRLLLLSWLQCQTTCLSLPQPVFWRMVDMSRTHGHLRQTLAPPCGCRRRLVSRDASYARQMGAVQAATAASALRG